MKQKLILLFFICCCFMLYAVPAKPGWHTLTQSDGTVLKVQAVGNAFNHALLTSDGLTVAMGEDGDYYYTSSLTGMTTVRAHEPSQRTATEKAFISAQRGHLTMQKKERSKIGGAPLQAIGGSNADSDVPAQGNRKVPIILVEYKDKKFKNTRQQIISAMLTGNSSVQQYFKDQSNGKYDPDFEVFGIYTLSQNRQYYGGNDSGGNDKGLGAMVTEACQMAAADGVSFSPFDTNNDNYCDVVIVIYAGVGEAQASYTVPSAIWPCNWNLQSTSYYGLGGSGAFRPNGSGPYVNNFAVFNEVHGSNDNGSTIDGIGTFCHEFGHCLGLPDFYDTNYGGHYGMGYWDIMDTGCYANDTYTPVGYSAYEKHFMGWIDYVKPQSGTYYTLPVWNQKQQSTDKAVRITSDLNENEFFILENRKRQGWDSFLPGEGMMITHVTYKASRWSDNSVNNEDIQLMTIVPADNTLSINNENTDLWPQSGKTDFTNNSTPAAILNMKANGSITSNAGYLNKPVTNIVKNTDGTIGFWYIKPPTITTSPSSLTFNNIAVGETATKTFKVTGSDLTGPLTLTLEETEGSNFSINKTSITATQAANGVTVTVTYKPTAVGSHGGRISISGGGASRKTVTLSGTAVSRTITASPTSLTFSNKTVGKTYTSTFTVKGTNLTGPLTLKLTGATGVFSINKTSITAAQAASGATVTVTYKPTAAGTQNATVTISGGDALSSKTVSLKGTSVTRTITTSASSLSFGAILKGKTLSKTFTVKGTNLTGPLTLKLTGATGMFSINKTSVTAAQAASGVTVTVTYKPTAAGTHNAKITISGGDALANKYVTLTGTCVVPTITASTTSLYMTKDDPSKTITVKGTNLNGSLTLTTKSAYFKVSPTTISKTDAANGVLVNVLFIPKGNIQHANDTITISGGGASPVKIRLSGTVSTPPIMVNVQEPECENNDFNWDDSLGSKQNSITRVDELAMNSKIYAEGLSIIIESPIEQSAIISDISGRAKTVNLQAGRNEIPVNSSGIYSVRIREKTTKLMLK